MGIRSDRHREAGTLKVQFAFALAAATAVALLAGVFTSQPWASAGNPNPLHGISFAKGCEVPTIVGETYKCGFLITNNLDQGPDTLTITSLVDVVHAHPADVNSGNVLPTLALGFLGGASCNGGQTQCTLPPGSSVFTTSPLAFYTTDASDPNPLTDDALLIWQDSCTSGVQNCPTGDQTISTGSQSPLYSPTPPPTNTSTNTPTATNTAVRSTSTPSNRSEPSNTPRAETATPRPNTPTPASTVAGATVVPPTPRPSGVTALPSTGDGGSGGSGLAAALIAGVATFGVLLAGSRIRALRSTR